MKALNILNISLWSMKVVGMYSKPTPWNSRTKNQHQVSAQPEDEPTKKGSYSSSIVKFIQWIDYLLIWNLLLLVCLSIGTASMGLLGVCLQSGTEMNNIGLSAWNVSWSLLYVLCSMWVLVHGREISDVFYRAYELIKVHNLIIKLRMLPSVHLFFGHMMLAIIGSTCDVIYLIQLERRDISQCHSFVLPLVYLATHNCLLDIAFHGFYWIVTVILIESFHRTVMLFCQQKKAESKICWTPSEIQEKCSKIVEINLSTEENEPEHSYLNLEANLLKQLDFVEVIILKEMHDRRLSHASYGLRVNLFFRSKIRSGER